MLDCMIISKIIHLDKKMGIGRMANRATYCSLATPRRTVYKLIAYRYRS